jgi:hypothetical protein
MSLIKRFSNKIKRGFNKIKFYKKIISRELEYRRSLKIHFLRRPLFYIGKTINALNVITRDNLLNQKDKYRTQYFGTEETVTFKMSFSEQVLLFSQAEMVVASHGAGLTNMIYSQNLKVIELFDSLVHLDYLLLANRLGFQYAFLMNQAPAGEIRREDGDIIIDITKLREVLSMIQEF